MNKEMIRRINELAHLSKIRDLTDAEKKEQAILRDEYRKAIKKSLLNDLSQVKIKNEDGTITDVIKKGE